MLQYYDLVDKFYFWDRSKHHEWVDYPFTKDMFKLKPEYESKMIRIGYRDAGSKSMGKYLDIERAFQGYPGPLTVALNHHFK